MATDVALARCLEDGEGVLRIYRWARPTLSLGRNQPARERYDPGAAEGLGAEIVRRPTGGREVMHDRELTYALVVPLGAVGGLREAYRTLNGALLTAIHSLGVPARAANGSGKIPKLGSGPCFFALANGEIEVGGRKLVGSAQARIGSVLLQHGSILLGVPGVDLEALRAPGREMDGAIGARDGSVGSESPSGHSPITLAEALARPLGFTEVARAVEAAFAGSLGGEWQRDGVRNVERETAATLLSQYESASWTWRK
ncbi:MAG: hypothetical protein EXR92_04715 [Gemmatimonadetes bacterium]|nr:hypothetical protein [Gemmatimonadota bacterium]